MKLEPIRYSFEPFASIQFNEGLASPVEKRPGMYIQCIDSYRCQRELSIVWNRQENAFMLHAYLHPMMRRANVKLTSNDEAHHIMDRINDICLAMPNRLFDKVVPRAEGFVTFHNWLLGGATIKEAMRFI